MKLEEMDAIGVTYGPGLVGALLVGVAEAKAISYASGIPLVGVHHIEGHISANYIQAPELEPPFICLVVSGGHTHLVVVNEMCIRDRNMDIIQKITEELQVKKGQVEAAVKLIDEGLSLIHI